MAELKPTTTKSIYDTGFDPYLNRSDTDPAVVSASQILSSNVDAFTFVGFSYSTSQDSANAANAANEIGFIMYDTTVDAEVNKGVILDFYKPTNTKYTFVSLQATFGNALHPIDGETSVEDVTFYLNPTKTKVTTGTFDYYKFSAGTEIRSNYDATGEGDTTTDVFTNAQIALIEDGWNSIVVQQETDGGDPGLVALNLAITGYVLGIK